MQKLIKLKNSDNHVIYLNYDTINCVRIAQQGSGVFVLHFIVQGVLYQGGVYSTYDEAEHLLTTIQKHFAKSSEMYIV